MLKILFGVDGKKKKLEGENTFKRKVAPVTTRVGRLGAHVLAGLVPTQCSLFNSIAFYVHELYTNAGEQISNKHVHWLCFTALLGARESPL